jgi:hypothetical protein
MDGVALASVISSASVAALTLTINAAGKRGDRKHVTNLEFQKRVWDTKSAALLSLIKTCEAINAAVTDPDADRETRQAAVWWRFHDVAFTKHTPELVAYASKTLNSRAWNLEREMQRASKTNALYLSMTNDAAIHDARRAKEEAIDRADFDAAARHRDEEKQYTRTLGAESGIDLDMVYRLCIDAVAEAREDLRS